MALGSENQPSYQRQQETLTNSNVGIYQQQQKQSHPRPIAPAPYTKSTMKVSNLSSYSLGTTLDSNNPAVVRRNARERNRVKQVNNGFVQLRQHIPQAIVADLSNGRRGIGPGANKKLSKVDTLRMALEYIRRLQRVIDQVDGNSSDTASVSSYMSCGSSTSSSPSPLSSSSSAMTNSIYNQQTQSAACYPLSYAGSFQLQHQQNEQQQQQQLQQYSMVISPAISTTSSKYSTSSNYEQENYHLSTVGYNNNNNNNGGESGKNINVVNTPSIQLKFEQPSFDEYPNTNSDDEELLDYISLWQEDM